MSGQTKIHWYRSPIEREALADLTKRSNMKGLVQALGHLLLVVSTGVLATAVVGRLPVWAWLLAFLVHGTVFGFLHAGVHEEPVKYFV